MNPNAEAGRVSSFADTNTRGTLGLGYVMAKSIDIQNFRGFQHARLDDCRRINVIVGDNASGKTALLEAIFLAGGGTPELAIRIKQWRGIDVIQVGGSRRQITESLYGDLFHEFTPAGGSIDIKLSGENELHSRSLRIESRFESSVVVTLPKQRGETEYTDQPDLVTFHWIGPRSKRHQASASLEQGKLVIKGGQESPLNVALFAANQTYSSAETAGRFSSLSRVGKEKVVIDAIRAQYEWVKSISIELISGVPLLFAQIDGHIEKLPINMLSGGMSKLASMLFAIPTSERGIVLIDELENGFYYERFPMIWRTLLALSEEYDVQLFVSTHSLECLEAAAEVARENPEKFSLIRAVRTPDKCILKQFKGDRLAGAIEASIEIR